MIGLIFELLISNYYIWFVFYFFFVKFYFLKLSDFLDIGFDDSFSEIFLLYIEDDLDSFIEVFNFVRDGFLDFLDDII